MGHSHGNYEIKAVAILCISFGVVNFEMFAISYLMPFIEPAMKLSNTQIGFLGSGFWIAFAMSSYLGGALADKLGKRKAILLLTLMLFSVASVLSGFATTFLGLLAARLLMGLLEGPFLPIAQSIIALESPVEHYGMNMGILQNLGSSILAGIVAPFMLANLATHYNWRVGFFIVALPGLICSAFVARGLREPSGERSARKVLLHVRGAASPDDTVGLREILRFRNVWLCAASFCCMMAYVTITLGFLPMFFIKIRHFSPEQMGILMSVLGISGLVLSVVVPAVSDHTGRKPMMIAGGLLGMLCPLAAMYFSGPLAILALLLFTGWGVGSAPTLISATIPSESVPARSISTAMGFIIAVGTLVGGVAGPALAGWSADRWGLSATLQLDVGCCVVVAVLSLALRESAPSRTTNLAAQVAPTPQQRRRCPKCL